jgi:hypothetical protein
MHPKRGFQVRLMGCDEMSRQRAALAICVTQHEMTDVVLDVGQHCNQYQR